MKFYILKLWSILNLCTVNACVRARGAAIVYHEKAGGALARMCFNIETGGANTGGGSSTGVYGSVIHEMN